MRLFSLLAVMFLSQHITAQNIPKPDFQFHFYYVDSANKKVVKLEKSSIEFGFRTNNVILSRHPADPFVFIEGKSSEVRIPEKDKQYFTILYPTNSDITGTFKLHKLDIKKGKRQYTHTDIKKNGRGVEAETESIIKCDAFKIDEGQFLIVPREHLKKGEYAFELGQLFSFGID